ncbi:MAG: SCO family protein [Bacteroidia bacterium]|nr:SCO family protein [Bacteroidia bacterium]
MNLQYKVTLKAAGTMLLIAVLAWVPQSLQAQKHKKNKKKHPVETGSCCDPNAPAASAELKVGGVDLGNPVLRNQNGEEVRFHDLIKGKVVAINFIFTTCTTICPPMGANFAELNRRMAEVRGDNLVMLSVSIDPVNDTPERLKAWSEKFKPGPGWTLLTGDKAVVDQLLKDLKVFTPLKEDHAPILMVGKEGEDNWIRTNGLAEVDLLESTILKYLGKTKTLNEEAPEPGSKPQLAPASGLRTPEMIERDRHYFTDTPLVDQNGKEYRFYSDLMENKVVIINPFFAECTGSCPVMNKMMQEVQVWLGDKLGSEVTMMTITVDPDHDTPTQLTDYARGYQAREGWHFLSGDKENVDLVMKKIGKYVDQREAHDTIILIGNLKTGLWKKANGLAAPQEIIEVLKTVMEDTGEDPK